MSTEFNEKARWAKLAGLPKVETPKVEEESKQQLDENVVGIGAINNPFPTRKPNDYELAFEHFLAEKYEKTEVKEEVTEEVTEEMTDAETEKIEKEVDAVRDDLDQISKLAKDAGEDAEDIKDMVDEAEIEEVGFGKGSTDGTEGFGDMLYKGMDEMYKKHGKDVVDEVLEMYHSKMKKDKGMEENSTTDAKFQKTGFAEAKTK
jgi:Holliday junction resolvase RusA-like endonuclease